LSERRVGANSVKKLPPCSNEHQLAERREAILLKETLNCLKALPLERQVGPGWHIKSDYKAKVADLWPYGRRFLQSGHGAVKGFQTRQRVEGVVAGMSDTSGQRKDLELSLEGSNPYQVEGRSADVKAFHRRRD
jgi:hypothetical protein